MLELTWCFTNPNATAGPTMKIPMNRISANTIENPICFEDRRSSSGMAWFAEMVRALMPIARDCHRAMTPRNPGQRRNRRRCETETSCDSRWMSPSGRRTATAQWSRPRIITPSMTACPPYRWFSRAGLELIRLSIPAPCRNAGSSALALAPPLGVAALEPLDAAAGVHQLLLARVERVAVRAELHAELGLRRPGLERVATRAVHRGHDVFGVNSLLHRC